MDPTKSFRRNWSSKYPGESLPGLKVLQSLAPEPKTSAKSAPPLEPGSVKAKKAAKMIKKDIHECEDKIRELERAVERERFLLGNLQQLQGSLMAMGVLDESTDSEGEEPQTKPTRPAPQPPAPAYEEIVDSWNGGGSDGQAGMDSSGPEEPGRTSSQMERPQSPLSTFKPRIHMRKPKNSGPEVASKPQVAEKPLPSVRRKGAHESCSSPSSAASSSPSLPGYVNINDFVKQKTADEGSGSEAASSARNSALSHTSSTRSLPPPIAIKPNAHPFQDDADPYAGPITQLLTTPDKTRVDFDKLFPLPSRNSEDSAPVSPSGETYGQLWSAYSRAPLDDSSSLDSQDRTDEDPYADPNRALGRRRGLLSVDDSVEESQPPARVAAGDDVFGGAGAGADSANQTSDKHEVRGMRPMSYRLAQWAEQPECVDACDWPSPPSPIVDVPNGYSAEEEEMLETRQRVMESSMKGEEDYVASLKTIVQYMKIFQVSASTPEAVIKPEDIPAVFSNLPDIQKRHETFLTALRERLQADSPVHAKLVADLFKERASSLDEYGDYIRNYPHALETVRRCSQENPRFSELTKEVKVRKGGAKKVEILSLEELLHKPVSRVQRNGLALNDLIRYTPKKHPDHEVLQTALEVTGYFLKQFKDPLEESIDKNQRHLVKSSFVVESVNGGRKLRHVFLFNDVLVCCKQKIVGRDRYSFDIKWYLPLSELFFEADDVEMTGEQDREAREHGEKVKLLKSRVMHTREQLRTEVEAMQTKAAAPESRGSVRVSSPPTGWKNRSISRGTRSVDKLQKKLAEQEAQLVLSSPSLVLRVKHGRDTDKSYTLLMASDFERQEWREMVKILQRKGAGGQSVGLYEIQAAVQSCPDVPRVNSIGSVLMKEVGDEELFLGQLNVTIHGLQGLRFVTDTHCAIELDSYGHFYTAACSKVCVQEKNPVWDESFELALEGASCVRVLCYQRQDKQDILLGKRALNIDKSWLTATGCHQDIDLTDLKLSLTVRYVPPEQTIRRTPSTAKTGVFGIALDRVVKREGGRVPLVVQYCAAEVEKRGLQETGIYRVSGATSDVQRLKKAFDKNSTAGKAIVEESDINAVCGVLKLYFRELPEALFTDALYPKLIQGAGLADPEARQIYLADFLPQLPAANRHTLDFMLDHLLRVNQHVVENKMSLHNLSTIFGPTLVRPGTSGDANLTDSAMGAMAQMRLMHCFLELRAKPAAPAASH